MIAEQRLLTVADVAAFLRIQPAAVVQLAQDGHLAYCSVNHDVRFLADDIMDYVHRCRLPVQAADVAPGDDDAFVSVPA